MYAFKKKKVNHKCSAQEIRGKILYSKSEENKRKEIKLRTLFMYMLFILYLINLYTTVQFITYLIKINKVEDQSKLFT